MYNEKRSNGSLIDGQDFAVMVNQVGIDNVRQIFGQNWDFKFTGVLDRNPLNAKDTVFLNRLRRCETRNAGQPIEMELYQRYVDVLSFMKRRAASDEVNTSSVTWTCSLHFLTNPCSEVYSCVGT